ncbi:MAG TPA: hypothetical protein VNN76_05830 [Bacteroidota bacterium]|nr:hypothetical protein [Bacteroidota bacterium]
MRKRILFFVGLSVLFLSLSSALPRFAGRTSYSCQSCHVNPTGGGLRSVFGVQYGRDDLPMETFKEHYSLDDFSTQISDFISYGMNFRFLYFYQQKERSGAKVDRSSFFPMQADMYFNLAVSKKINIYANPAFGLFSRYEIFAVAKVLPLNGYVKVGRFYPPYGLRHDDHTTFVREITPFRNYQGQDAGVEAGISPGPITIVGAVMNGGGGDRAGSNPTAYLANAWGQVKLGPVNSLLGVSAYDNAVSSTNKIRLLTAYGIFSFRENLTLIVDAQQVEGNSTDLKVNSERRTGFLVNPFNTSGATQKQRALYIEADYLLTSGVDLKLAYDFFDPSTEFTTGIAQRYGIGFELFPISGIELRPMFRMIDDTIIHLKANEFHLLFHYYL